MCKIWYIFVFIKLTKKKHPHLRYAMHVRLRRISHLGVVFLTVIYALMTQNVFGLIGTRTRTSKHSVLFFLPLYYLCHMRSDWVLKSAAGALHSLASSCESAGRVSGVRSNRVWLALETKRNTRRETSVRSALGQDRNNKYICEWPIMAQYYTYKFNTKHLAKDLTLSSYTIVHTSVIQQLQLWWGADVPPE